jgi:hypothetical protein
MTYQIIHIKAEAPIKPPIGEACNGCGVCCIAEPCPVSLVFLWPHQAPCKALVWSKENQRYFCGMVLQPSNYIAWLPTRLDNMFSKMVKRWIAANSHCDADVSLE